uniref:MACPF domain-containing protein n=1 Tax=Babesia bovis TaxID=5865 RepID=A7AM15_BABBO|eukprot:XP_001611167.1 hypothetical protein [Babesia bovis T2Bo]
MGYDAVLGNPFGSLGQDKDSGYRNPILETHVTISGDKTKSSEQNGLWVRELSTCWISDTHDDVGDDELVRELQNEFTVEGSENSELLSASINSMADDKPTSKHTVNYRIAKSFCAIRESGIMVPFTGKISSVFIKEVEALPSINEDYGPCTPDVFIVDPLKSDCSSMHQWVKFFKRYGTHMTSHITIGGQIISIDRMVEGEKITKMVKTLGGGESIYKVTDKFSSVMTGKRESHQMLILGGYYFSGLESNDSKAFNRWSKSVWERPMPIRANFTSLEHFMGDKSKSYQHAVRFYRGVQNVANGHSLNYTTISQMLKETVTVVSNTGSAYCPTGMSVVSGFVMTKTEPFHIDSCVASSDVLKDNVLAVALCAKGAHINFVTIESKERRKCPNDLVVAFGFQMFTDETSAMQLASCPIGQADCGDMPGKGGIEWKVCTQRNLLDSNFEPRTAATREGYYANMDCPSSQKVVSGFVLRRTRGSLQVDSCMAGISSCSIQCTDGTFTAGNGFIICL